MANIEIKAGENAEKIKLIRNKDGTYTVSVDNSDRPDDKQQKIVIGANDTLVVNARSVESITVDTSTAVDKGKPDFMPRIELNVAEVRVNNHFRLARESKEKVVVLTSPGAIAGLTAKKGNPPAIFSRQVITPASNDAFRMALGVTDQNGRKSGSAAFEIEQATTDAPNEPGVKLYNADTLKRYPESRPAILTLEAKAADGKSAAENAMEAWGKKSGSILERAATVLMGKPDPNGEPKQNFDQARTLLGIPLDWGAVNPRNPKAPPIPMAAVKPLSVATPDMIKEYKKQEEAQQKKDAEKEKKQQGKGQSAMGESSDPADLAAAAALFASGAPIPSTAQLLDANGQFVAPSTVVSNGKGGRGNGGFVQGA